MTFPQVLPGTFLQTYQKPIRKTTDDNLQHLMNPNANPCITIKHLRIFCHQQYQGDFFKGMTLMRCIRRIVNNFLRAENEERIPLIHVDP